MPSSCSSSGILQDTAPPSQPITVDLLMMDPIGEVPAESPGDFQKSTDDVSTVVEKKSSITAPKKLSMFIPKRRKTVSTSSIDETPQAPTSAEPFSASGLFKFSREKRRSKKDSESGLRASVW